MIAVIKEIEKKENLDPINLALKIYFEDNYIYRKKLENKMISLCLDKKNNEFRIDNRLLNFIMSNANSEPEIKEIKVFFPNANTVKTEREKEAQRIAEICENEDKHYFFVKSEKGFGKKTLIKRSAQIASSSLVIIDLAKCDDHELNFSEIITAVFRETLLVKGFVCFDNFDLIQKNTRREFILENARNFTTNAFFLSQNNVEFEFEDENVCFLNLNLEKLKLSQIANIWKDSLKKVKADKVVNVSELANIFEFPPKRIQKTIKNLAGLKVWGKKITRDEIFYAARLTLEANFNGKAIKIKSCHDWDDLILPDEEKQMLKDACLRQKFKNIVFEKWNMKTRVLYGQGLSMLFSGPSGTGKTMASGIVAKELGLELYRADLSRLISKYIGETEKNLSSVFDEAKKCNMVLLFDETDALFSKRTAVKDSHDRGANIEISYLLQKMEEFDGICVMTTNFLENIDKAFFRRITYIINFSLPSRSEREKIWQSMLKSPVPIDKNIDLNFLSKFEISGGTIKNTVISAAFLAAQQNRKIEIKDLIKSLIYELKKLGHTIIKSDFSEYSYLTDI